MLIVRVILSCEARGTLATVNRALVHDDPGFAAFFRDITPIAELSGIRLGSRPSARGRRTDEAPPIDALRAIPWTFAWSQSRIGLPGWYGLGTALEAYRAAHGDAGFAEIGRLYRAWPFLSSVLDNAEMILAKADMGVARRYATLVADAGGAGRGAAPGARTASRRRGCAGRWSAGGQGRRPAVGRDR